MPTKAQLMKQVEELKTQTSDSSAAADALINDRITVIRNRLIMAKLKRDALISEKSRLNVQISEANGVIEGLDSALSALEQAIST